VIVIEHDPEKLTPTFELHCAARYSGARLVPADDEDDVVLELGLTVELAPPPQPAARSAAATTITVALRARTFTRTVQRSRTHRRTRRSAVHPG
jgi:hypothetical protein